MKYLRFVENVIIYVATTVPSLLTRLLKNDIIRIHPNKGRAYE